MRDRKDSGLPWVGDIPVDWNVYRGKNVVKKLKRPVKDTDGVITCFRDGEVTLRSNRREEGFTFSEQEVGYQGIEPGDLVIHGMDGFAGSIGISDSRGKGTPVLNVLDSKNDKRFLMYYFRTIAKCGYFESVATGIRVRTCDTNWNKISATPCLVPPLAEQYRIAAYLDERCAKIDEAIARHDALIKRLDEYRKAVIIDAVTKGVRGKREMKESGIEWIGQIPSEWSVKRGKFFLTLLNRPTVENDGVITCFRDGEVTLRSRRREEGFTFAIQEAGYQGIEPGDLVIHKMDGFAGAIGVSDSRGKGTPALNVLDSSENKDYLKYYFRAVAFLGYFESIATGIRVRTCDTGWPKIQQTPCMLPSQKEQSEIVAYLDEKCAAIDAAKERHAQLMAKLEEYKKSLIYYAVTGKIEC